MLIKMNSVPVQKSLEKHRVRQQSIDSLILDSVLGSFHVFKFNKLKCAAVSSFLSACGHRRLLCAIANLLFFFFSLGGGGGRGG